MEPNWMGWICDDFGAGGCPLRALHLSSDQLVSWQERFFSNVDFLDYFLVFRYLDRLDVLFRIFHIMLL